MYIQCSPLDKLILKAWWVDVVWVELMTTSKFVALSYSPHQSYIVYISVLKARVYRILEKVKTCMTHYQGCKFYLESFFYLINKRYMEVKL